MQELQELGRQHQQEAQATSLLQRFVGAFNQPIHKDPVHPPEPAWLQPQHSQHQHCYNHTPEASPPSWLNGLLEGIASRFGTSSEATQPPDKQLCHPSNLTTLQHDKQHEEDMARLRQELQTLKDQKRRQEQEAEKQKLLSEIEAMRGGTPEDTLAADGKDSQEEKKPTSTETGTDSVADWLQVDVEKWALEDVFVTKAQQNMWIAKVRPSCMKGWSRSAKRTSTRPWSMRAWPRQVSLRGNPLKARGLCSPAVQAIGSVRSSGQQRDEYGHFYAMLACWCYACSTAWHMVLPSLLSTPDRVVGE